MPQRTVNTRFMVNNREMVIIMINMLEYTNIKRIRDNSAVSNVYSTTPTYNMKEYVIIAVPKNVNMIVRLFGAPISVEELFADTSDDGSKASTRDILAQHFFVVFLSLFLDGVSFVNLFILSSIHNKLMNVFY